MTLLKIDSIVHRFGGLLATNNVSFSINKGEIVSLIGPNGAGKTTIFNIIAGVYCPSSGSIQYNSREIRGLPTAEIANLGVIRTFQVTSLFPASTVLENILIGRHRKLKSNLLQVLFNTKSTRKEEQENREKCLEILKFIGLEKKKDELACNLPYGEQRLMEIGIALAADPELLMLDEPAAGLNPTETKELMVLIKKLQESSITIFLVEHDMNLVMGISDRVIVVANGEKIAEGLPEEIQKNEQVISAYLGDENINLLVD